MMRSYIVLTGLLTCLLIPLSAQSEIFLLKKADALILESDSLRDGGVFSLAEMNIDSAKVIYRQLEKWEGFVSCFDKAARIYDYQDLHEKRIPILEEGIEYANSFLKPNAEVLGRLYRQKAEALIGLNDLEQVASNLSYAKAIFEHHNACSDYGWTLILEAVHVYYTKEYHEMERPLEEVLAIATPELEDAYQLKSTACQLLTVLYEELGDVRKAISAGDKSLKIRESHSDLGNQDSVFIASIHQNIGLLNSQLGDRDKAYLHFQEAQRILELLSVPVPIQKAQNRNAIGSILSSRSEFERAADLFRQNLDSLDIRHPEAEETQIATLQNLALLYLENKQYVLAEKTIQLALVANDKNRFQADRTYILSGNIFEATGNYSAAVNAYLQAIKEIQTDHPGNHPQIALARNHLGELALLQEEPEKAAHYAQAAISQLVDSFSSTDISQNPAYPVTMARKFLLQAFEVKRQALLMLHAQHPKRELLENAFAVSQLSVVLLDSMRQDLQEDNAQQKLMKRSMEVYEGGIELAWQLYQEDPDETYLTKAFEISEKSKAILLLRQFRREEAIEFGNIPTHLLQREKTLRLEILYYERQLFEENSKSDPSALRISNWQQTVFHLKEDYRQLMDTVAIISPEYHRIKHDTRVVSTAYVQQKLPPAGAWLQYFEGKSYRYVFGITASGVRLHRVRRDDQQVLDFVAGMSQPEYAYDPGRFAAWTRSGHALYQDLVGAVIGPDIEHLTIVPDGVLSFLPFEVLLREAVPATALNYQQLPYLLRDFVMGYDYSATLHAKDASAVGRRKKGPLAGFAPVFSTDLAMAESEGAGMETALADLRYNQTEIQRIASMAGGSMYLGTAATESIFRKDAPDFQILHLATHALTNDENPWLSGLAFATEEGEEDGFLHTFEICQMEIPAQLAVLSACNTAKGTVKPGAGVMSLAWAFKYAGCPSIVMSQWQVDDAATHDIMSNLYRYLREGKTTAAALRQAKLDFLDTSVRVHPYYWSAFVYLGQEMPLEWERPWYQKPPYWIALLLLAVSFLAGAIRFYNRN